MFDPLANPFFILTFLPNGRQFTRCQGVAEYLTLSREPCEKAESLPEEILEVGDKIVVFVHFQAWPKGGGQLREGHIADVSTVQDGKIVQMQAYSDPEEARKALGLSPHRSTVPYCSVSLNAQG